MFDRSFGGKTLKLSDYLNQIQDPLATSRALQRFGTAKATRLQDLAWCLTGPQFLEEDCWKRGGLPFSWGVAIFR